MTANQLGSHTPQCASGAVYSVHEHAINILDEAAGTLISIIDRQSDLTGLAILVDSLPAPPGVGVRARVLEHELRVGADPQLSLHVLWSSETPRFTGTLPFLPAPPVRVGVINRLARLCTLLRASGQVGGLLSLGLGDPPNNLFARRAASLLAEAGGGRGGRGNLEVADGLARLIGLGPGFTPSGDDFAAGALAAAALFPAATDFDTGPLAARLDATTPAGATLLSLALRRCFPAYLVRFADALLAPESDLRAAVDEALSHGATSGADTLSGFLWMARRSLSLTNS